MLDGLRTSTDIPRRGGWCFPSNRKPNAPLVDLRKPFVAVCEQAGIQGLRLHDLRHAHASVAAGEGLSLLLIGRLLGHKRASTTERYAHLADNPARDAADRAQGGMASRLAAQPKEQAQGGEVVELRP